MLGSVAGRDLYSPLHPPQADPAFTDWLRTEPGHGGKGPPATQHYITKIKVLGDWKVNPETVMTFARYNKDQLFYLFG